VSRPLLSRLAGALVAWAAAGVMAAAPSGASAQGHDAQVSIDVPKGKMKSVRLRRLPLGTSLAVAVAASGGLRVALVSARELQSTTPKAIFSGGLEHKMAFKVVIPESGDYYLVLDNRRGGDDVHATAAVRAEPRQQPPPARPPVREKNDERAGLARPFAT